jgi:hypothetical protein
MKRQKREAPKYMPYPPHDDVRSGCKVGWYYYKSHEAAEQCATAARHNAAIQASLGYDFGYQSPGSITQCNENHWPEYDGLYEVCIP